MLRRDERRKGPKGDIPVGHSGVITAGETVFGITIAACMV
jgi:hypothetical protein